MKDQQICTKLIMLAGPPGVGKSTVAKELSNALQKSVWLDGDEVWRINPFSNTPEMKEMALQNVIHLLRSFEQAGFDYIILSWVLHQDTIISDIRAALAEFDLEVDIWALVCDEDELERRIIHDQAKSRDTGLAKDRLHQVRELSSATLIDTTNKAISSVVQEILAGIS